MDITPNGLRCLCGGSKFSTTFTYTAPPKPEIHYEFSRSQRYFRKVFQCEICGHFQSVHHMNADQLYSGEYVNSTYGENGIRRAFDRINALDPTKSDNIGRVRRIVDYASRHWPVSEAPQPPHILDVGSGLCVFLYRMKEAGWNCTALDPDPRATAHAKDVAGVDQTIHGDFMKVKDGGRYDVVTFNKVLEHVQDPVAMLAKALDYLKPGGFVYIELPDGEIAAKDGSDREEFTIEHWHVFSAASIALLAQQAGFSVRVLERLYEPSTKYTLRAFLVPTPARTSRDNAPIQRATPQEVA